MYPVTSLDIGSMFKTGMMAFGVIMVLIFVASGNLAGGIAYFAIPWWIKGIEIVASIFGGIGLLAFVLGLRYFNVI